MEWDTIASVTAQEIPDDGIFVLALAQYEDSTAQDGHYLIFQIPLDDPSEDDRAMGMDTYCMVRDDGATCYGGLRYVEVASQYLSMYFDPQAASELGLDGTEVQFTLQLPDDHQPDALFSALKRILHYGDPSHRPTLVAV